MDFGIGFISNNVMLPILDFFYGIVPSYGLAIIALTLVIRVALFPLNAGSLRNMRKMKVTQPLMQKRMKEIQERHKNDPSKQQEEISAVYKEYGNPLAGCLPLVFQMPVLFALFATLRGSPFSDVPYSINLQVLPQDQMAAVQLQAFVTKPSNIYLSDGVHAPVLALLPGGNKLGVGEHVAVEFQTPEGKPFSELAAQYPDSNLKPKFKAASGGERIKINDDGSIDALQAGDVTLQALIPGLAAEKGFLFIDALGRVGAIDEDLWTLNADGSKSINFKAVHFDVLGMIIFYGISLYVSQLISGQGATSSNPQQDTVNKITPFMISGIFLFAPLPAGVLMYMIIANLFQIFQSFIIMREPLPENLQNLAVADGPGMKSAAVKSDGKADKSAKSKDKSADKAANKAISAGDDSLPFEPGKKKKA
jgi:YidC/Oxa1 family membrane protein insertase